MIINRTFLILSIIFSLINGFFELSSLGIIATNFYLWDTLFLSLRFYWGFILLIWFSYSIYIIVLTHIRKQNRWQMLIAGLFIFQYLLVFFSFYILFFYNNIPNNLSNHVIVWLSQAIPVITLVLSIYLLYKSKHSPKLPETIAINTESYKPKPIKPLVKFGIILFIVILILGFYINQKKSKEEIESKIVNSPIKITELTEADYKTLIPDYNTFVSLVNPLDISPTSEEFKDADGTDYKLYKDDYGYFNEIYYKENGNYKKLNGIDIPPSSGLDSIYNIFSDHGDFYIEVSPSGSVENGVYPKRKLYELKNGRPVVVTDYDSIISGIPYNFGVFNCKQSGPNTYCLSSIDKTLPPNPPPGYVTSGTNLMTIYKLEKGKLLKLETVEFKFGPIGGSGLSISKDVDNKGQSYAILGNQIYKIDGKNMQQVSGVDYSKFPRVSTINAKIQYVSGSWYLVFDNSFDNNSQVYELKEMSALNIPQLDNLRSVDFFSIGSSTFSVASKVIPGFCGDAICQKSLLFAVGDAKLPAANSLIPMTTHTTTQEEKTQSSTKNTTEPLVTIEVNGSHDVSKIQTGSEIKVTWNTSNQYKWTECDTFGLALKKADGSGRWGDDNNHILPPNGSMDLIAEYTPVSLGVGCYNDPLKKTGGRDYVGPLLQ